MKAKNSNVKCEHGVVLRRMAKVQPLLSHVGGGICSGIVESQRNMDLVIRKRDCSDVATGMTLLHLRVGLSLYVLPKRA